MEQNVPEVKIVDIPDMGFVLDSKLASFLKSDEQGKHAEVIANDKDGTLHLALDSNVSFSVPKAERSGSYYLPIAYDVSKPFVKGDKIYFTEEGKPYKATLVPPVEKKANPAKPSGSIKRFNPMALQDQ